ncbi:MAG: carbamate kinase [Nitrospirales bacterium]|nr:carbamate kinase [Nitrospirales bacterium]
MSANNKLAIVAIGGNALIVDEGHNAIPDQAEAAARTSRYIADIAEAGWNIVVAHGNGPQVGFILRRSEIALSEVPPVPMDYASADTQGAIGYMFQRALHNEFRCRGIRREVITMVTQVLVDRNDPAFGDPTKPIGSYMDENTARKLGALQNWQVREDSGRGWRRVVPSPLPREIIEIKAIRHLVDDGYVVVACGGGGIPVYENESGALEGAEAVIDKDLASSLLARQLRADMLLICTSVEKVAVNFNTPDERWLDSITLREAQDYRAQGQFGKGSMEPKISALISYIEDGGATGIITNPPNMARAIAGKAGTCLVLD